MTTTELVADLQEKITQVDSTITLSAGTDIRLLNLGWRRFWKKLMKHGSIVSQYFNSGKQEVLVDSSGFITLPARSRVIIFIRQKNGQRRRKITLEQAEIFGKTGWVYAGQDASGNLRINVYESGVIASENSAYEVWTGKAPLDLAVTADASHIDTPTVPEEHHGIITDFGAHEYFSRFGLSYQGEAGKWLNLGNGSTMEAIEDLSWMDDEPEFIEEL